MKTILLNFRTMLLDSTDTNKLMETAWFKGGMQFISDATAVLMIALPSLGVLISLYFWFRWGTAAQEDKKRWWDRAVGCMLIGAILGVVSGLGSVLASYLT